MAPVPRTDLEVTGDGALLRDAPARDRSPCCWSGRPSRGRWRLGRGVGLIGMIGIARQPAGRRPAGPGRRRRRRRLRGHRGAADRGLLGPARSPRSCCSSRPAARPLLRSGRRGDEHDAPREAAGAPERQPSARATGATGDARLGGGRVTACRERRRCWCWPARRRPAMLAASQFIEPVRAHPARR